MRNKKFPDTLKQGIRDGGISWARTNDLHDVNVAL